jgi:nitric oxide reductase NorD protein
MVEEGTNSTSVLGKVEGILEPILSPRQPLKTVEESIKPLSINDQRFALHWIEVVSVSNIELAYSFAIHVGAARAKLDLEGVRIWLLESLALYDREGLYPATSALKDIGGFKYRYTQQKYVCKLKEVKPRLDIFIRGLAGRALGLKPGEETYTDTRYLYLPEIIAKYRDKEKNRALYKAMACFLWAQTWYGTFKRKGYSSLTTQARLDAYTDVDTAKRYFLTLENIRLLANIERDLPGLFREMSVLSPLIVPEDPGWKVASRKLGLPGANVEDTFEALDVLMRLNISIPFTEYQGGLNLGEVEQQIENRKAQAISDATELIKQTTIDKNKLQQAIKAFNAAQGSDQETVESTGDGDKETQSSDGVAKSSQEASRLSDLLRALLQDVEYFEEGLFGDIPTIASNSETASVIDHSLSSSSLASEQINLDEWDYLRQNYRSQWCRVNVNKVEGIEDGFRQQTKDKYPFLLSQIQKIFEAMRDQPRHANRQTDGEDIDLDAVVDTYTASLAGEELSERMYIRRQRNERSVSVCLLVDMSGSTKGWINLAMRESLILFSEALNTLGDQYAIVGFSGLTRQRCEIYSVKEFLDAGTEEISNRISNIQAKDYTRMGFAVRYATRCLLRSEAKHRILLMLSDGKPDDYDGYQGEYGIQDTRKAILEAQGHSIKPYSITIDKQAQVYLPRLFGPGQYMILNDVSTLPLKLSEVYKKISG